MKLSKCSIALLAVCCGACSDADGSQHPLHDAGADLGGDASASDMALVGDASGDAAADDASVGASAMCVSGLTQHSEVCRKCVDSNCCITATACAERPGTWPCSASTMCRANNCAAECDLTPPTCGDIALEPAVCLDAFRAACCDELSACGESDECVAVVYICIDEMGCAPRTACFDTCTAAYPAGRALFDAADECISTVSC